MPLVIYVDIFLIVNLYLDFFLLWCVRGFLRLPTGWGRLVLGALCGALSGLVSLLPLPHWLLLAAGGLAALAATAGAFCPMAWRQLLRAWLCLWLFSFLLAGFFLFLIRFFAPANIAVLGSAVYLDLSLPLLFFFTGAAYVVFSIFHRLFPRDASSLRLCTLVITHNGHTAEVTAKADTGNALREPFSALPVILCEAGVLGPAAPAAALHFLSDPTAAPDHIRLVPFDTVGGSGILPAFCPDSVTVKGSSAPMPCYIALLDRPLSSGQFSALFNPDLF